MTVKTSECYWQAFNWVTSVVDSVAPAFIGVDFERAFYTQDANHFTEAEIIGCLFHFKQAMHRQMKKLGIPNDKVKFHMRKGIVDLIIVVLKDDLNPKGINFIAAMIFDYCAELYCKGTDEYEE